MEANLGRWDGSLALRIRLLLYTSPQFWTRGTATGTRRAATLPRRVRDDSVSRHRPTRQGFTG